MNRSILHSDYMVGIVWPCSVLRYFGMGSDFLKYHLFHDYPGSDIHAVMYRHYA